ncbi:MAG: hypothetical protein IJ498_09330 [Akkermansia sp.]|nr:hypothetical protein [Akkermansia sp.]
MAKKILLTMLAIGYSLTGASLYGQVSAQANEYVVNTLTFGIPLICIFLLIYEICKRRLMKAILYTALFVGLIPLLLYYLVFYLIYFNIIGI